MNDGGAPKYGDDDIAQAVEFILIVSIVVFTIAGCALVNCWMEGRRQAQYDKLQYDKLSSTSSKNNHSEKRQQNYGPRVERNKQQ
jgi:hypothetical protein